ncbi:MAG: N-acyl homoserine lactonase family protein [Pseudomonadota bacterium]
MNWEVYAVKYADRPGRTRSDSFLFDDHPSLPHGIDYFVWVLKSGTEVILVDTGYDVGEAKSRARPILRDPGAALAPLGLRAEDIGTLICTHLHYDHAGGLHLFPRATIHMQAAEMAFATGPCMCDPTMKMPFTGAHICEAVTRLYQGRVRFYDGDGEIADGVSVHKIGGHSRGLQAVRVRTAAGWLCLASDAAHYYENVFARKPFPIVVDLEDMVRGWDRVQSLASRASLVIPGHDPLISDIFPAGPTDFIRRLDAPPLREVPV